MTTKWCTITKMRCKERYKMTIKRHKLTTERCKTIRKRCKLIVKRSIMTAKHMLLVVIVRAFQSGYLAAMSEGLGTFYVPVPLDHSLINCQYSCLWWQIFMFLYHCSPDLSWRLLRWGGGRRIIQLRVSSAALQYATHQIRGLSTPMCTHRHENRLHSLKQ